jgi:hypothetical protein
MRFLRPFEIEPTEYVDGVIINAKIETNEVIVDFDLSESSIRDINPYNTPISKWRCEATLSPYSQEIAWFVDSVSFDDFYFEYEDSDGNSIDGTLPKKVVAYPQNSLYTNRSVTSIVVTVLDKGSTNPEEWIFQISSIND